MYRFLLPSVLIQVEPKCGVHKGCLTDAAPRKNICYLKEPDPLCIIFPLRGLWWLEQEGLAGHQESHGPNRNRLASGRVTSVTGPDPKERVWCLTVSPVQQ